MLVAPVHAMRAQSFEGADTRMSRDENLLAREQRSKGHIKKAAAATR